METRKDTLGAIKLCRFCLTQDEPLTSLYDRRQAPKNAVSLPLKILSCVSIEVFPSDRMPSYICNRCKFFMEVSYDFKQLCRQADENVLEFIQTGSELCSMKWPPNLQKLYRVATKSTPILKTIVEGGATVQVTAQESDSEGEDSEHVYNIKMEDGSDECPKSARVKVVTADSDTKQTPKPSFTSISKLTRHVRSHAGERSFPCKHCDKSFLKSHHYTRHLRVKHRNVNRTSRGPFGSHMETYRCEQCEDTFMTQDELIYHSAIHATQNLICPLCQEKFEDVDAVTAHIKSHVNGTEFMCDLCELVFTSKEKLDSHMEQAHSDEVGNEDHDQDESEMEVDEEEDDASINVKEESDHMVVEIKKTNNFILPTLQDDTEEKNDNTNCEESEPEIYNDLLTEDISMTIKEVEKVVPENIVAERPIEATVTKIIPVSTNNTESQGPPILRKAEEVKRKVLSVSEPAPEKKIVKPESNNTGASDKSLRLLEKELQELKRTNIRNEYVKSTAKLGETPRHKRIPVHTSTPKIRSTAAEEKKVVLPNKSPITLEKKVLEKRIVTKENKEPKDLKETKTNNVPLKEEKEVKERDSKEKDTPKASASQIKNNVNEKVNPEEGIRRSTRPSKIKDYARMIRDRAQVSDQEDSEDIDEEYKDTEKIGENKVKVRRLSVKQTPKQGAAGSSPAPSPGPAGASSTPAATPRKRGRPRKAASKSATPAKVKKNDAQEAKSAVTEENKKTDESRQQNVQPSAETDQTKKTTTNNIVRENEATPEANIPTGVFVSPTGQTLKKIPVKALPPGITPIPLPRNARPIGASELCKMQFGKKLVNVQKIVMTKAEVEAMTKKGLVHMKDGTMVLKQGVKLPTSDSMLKSLVADDRIKESPKKEKATPTRCDIDDDA